MIQYTSYDTLRGVLGIDDLEIEDERFDSLNLDTLVSANLRDWLPNHDAIWTQGQDPNATEEEVFLANALSLWTQYFCAAEIADAGTFMFQSMTDGETTFKRFDVDFPLMAAMFRKKANNWKSVLLEMLDMEPEIVVKGLGIMGISSPSFDPVTGQ